MANSPQSYTEKTVQLYHRIEATVNDLIRTTPISPSSEWDSLKESARRWMKSFRILEGIHQKGHLLKWDSVFLFLTSGMDETLDSLCSMKTENLTEQTPQRLGRLEARIAYHAESIALISVHFERQWAKHVPNPETELRRMGEIWIRQKTDLEATLKNVFGCSSSDLLWHKFTTIQATAKAPSSPLSNPPSPVFTSIPFIAKLKLQPEASFLYFPQYTSFHALIRASIYLLDILHSSMGNVVQVATGDLNLTRDFVNFYKCAWVVHNLVKYSESMHNLAWEKEITRLILDKLYIFARYNHQQFPLANSIPLQSCDLSIRDPLSDTLDDENLESTIDSRSVSTSVQDPNSTPSSSSLVKSESSNQVGISVHEDEARRVGEHHHIQTLTASESRDEQLCEPMSLLTAVASGPLDQQKWMPSEVLILKSGGNLRLRIQQKGSLHLEITVNRESDEIVPGYAFIANSQSSRPALWFRQKVGNKVLHFSAANGLVDLIDFTNCFIGDGELMSHFPLINKIEIRRKKSSTPLMYLNPTAQAWTAVSDEMGKDSGPSSQSIQTFQTQQHITIGPIGQQIEESKIIFFCRTSIFTMLVTDQTVLEKHNATSLTISSRAAYLPMHETSGTSKQLAGIPMSFSRMSHAGNSTGERKEYLSVQLDFPSSEGMQVFVQDFSICQKKWLAKAERLKSRRDLQRNPIIETKSHFTRNFLSKFF